MRLLALCSIPAVMMLLASCGATSTATGASRSGKTVRRAHMTISDSAAGKELRRLLDSNASAREDFLVVTRLMKEKQSELASFQQALTDEFGLDPKRNYQYEKDTLSIYELPNQAGSVSNSPAASPNEDVHAERRALVMKLDERQSSRFIALSASMALTREQIRCFALLLREKELEIARYREMLLKKFSMSRDRGYEYDEKAGIVYEIVGAPTAHGELQR